MWNNDERIRFSARPQDRTGGGTNTAGHILAPGRIYRICHPTMPPSLSHTPTVRGYTCASVHVELIYTRDLACTWTLQKVHIAQ